MKCVIYRQIVKCAWIENCEMKLICFIIFIVDVYDQSDGWFSAIWKIDTFLGHTNGLAFWRLGFMDYAG